MESALFSWPKLFIKVEQLVPKTLVRLKGKMRGTIWRDGPPAVLARKQEPGG
jgi:hypothetical protein